MVQVDVFWAYGLGGSLAAAAGRQLRGRPEVDPSGQSSEGSFGEMGVRVEKQPFVTSYFVKTVLFLALIWAPTGLLLLLRHPSWETMQAAPNLASMPPFLVLGFGITNVTQGILGFWIGQRLIARGRHYAAHFNWLAGYIGMFFILIYGWDGLGYDRFFYDRDMVGGVAWSAGSFTYAAIPRFFSSSVARTLYLDGVFLLPPLLYWFGTWIVDGAKHDTSIPEREKPKSAPFLALLYLAAVFLLAIPTAGLGAACTHLAKRTLVTIGVGAGVAHILAYVIGIPIAGAIAYALVYQRGGIGHTLLRKFYVDEPRPIVTKTHAPLGF